ncbi:MAG: hypothetical protein ACYS0H_00480 [Planctomycetota bacterium]|jgi:hypothetical protein
MTQSAIKSIFQKKGDGFFGSLYEEAFLDAFRLILQKKIEATYGPDLEKIAGKVVETMRKHSQKSSGFGEEISQGREEIRSIIESLSE